MPKVNTTVAEESIDKANRIGVGLDLSASMMDRGGNSGSYHKLPKSLRSVLCPSCIRFRRGVEVPRIPRGWVEFCSSSHERSKCERKAKMVQKIKVENQLKFLAEQLVCNGREECNRTLAWTLKARRASDKELLLRAIQAASQHTSSKRYACDSPLSFYFYYAIVR